MASKHGVDTKTLDEQGSGVLEGHPPCFSLSIVAIFTIQKEDCERRVSSVLGKLCNWWSSRRPVLQKLHLRTVLNVGGVDERQPRVQVHTLERLTLVQRQIPPRRGEGRSKALVCLTLTLTKWKTPCEPRRSERRTPCKPRRGWRRLRRTQ